MKEKIAYRKVSKNIYKTPTGRYRVRVLKNGKQHSSYHDLRRQAVAKRDELLAQEGPV